MLIQLTVTKMCTNVHYFYIISSERLLLYTLFDDMNKKITLMYFYQLIILETNKHR